MITWFWTALALRKQKRAHLKQRCGRVCTTGHTYDWRCHARRTPVDRLVRVAALLRNIPEDPRARRH